MTGQCLPGVRSLPQCLGLQPPSQLASAPHTGTTACPPSTVDFYVFPDVSTGVFCKTFYCQPEIKKINNNQNF